MKQWAIIADLPLGVYRGHTSDGSIDPVPAPARLHGALLNAAAQGPRADLVAGALRPRAADLAALQWLENNPPTGVHIPQTRRGSTPRAHTVYRDEGTLRKEGGMSGPGKKKSAKPLGQVIAVKGSFAWTWDTTPPPAVVDSFAALVGDVSHLGTAESPARLRVGTERPTHHLDVNASVHRGTGEDLDVAAHGRTTALITAYEAEQRLPRLSEDKYTTSEEPRPRSGWSVGRRTARYVRPEATPADAPWEAVLIAQLDGDPVEAIERVAFAVAVHRALVRRIGDGAPPVVTGHYPEGAERPANRLAIQILDDDASAFAGLGPTQHLAILLPRGTHPVDVAIITQAVQGLKRIRQRALGERQIRSAEAFWPTPPVEQPRLWRIVPAAVPDSRSPRKQNWTLEHVARLSTAMVFRDLMTELTDPPVPGVERYLRLVEAAERAGVQVHDGMFLRTTQVANYVHKAPERGVVRPYSALISLGTLTDRALVAVGQSRHLGGGLLVPLDGADGGAR